MPTTITASTGSPATTTPIALSGYKSARASLNRVHRLIGGGVAIATGLGVPRAGRMQLVYSSRAEAFAAFNMHARPATFTLTQTDIGQVGMTYVIAENGGVEIMLSDATRSIWTVAVDFQEVS